MSGLNNLKNKTMSNNKFGVYLIGQEVKFNETVVTILNKIKGNKTNTPSKQGGIKTGYKSNPCLYILSNGFTVRGSKLQKIKKEEQ